MPQIIVLTDLDGTLLDAATYSFEGASEALKALKERKIPLILVSSKTRAEIEPIRFSLGNHDPFIVENGGGVHIPKGLFPFPLEGAVLRGPYQVMESGTSYVALRAALKEIEQTIGCPLRGFGDMSAQEIAERTGLDQQDALLAKQREYDEPFVVEGRSEVVDEIRRQSEARGLRFTSGGRFFHLTGNTDKGRACQQLIGCYVRQQGETPEALVTIGIGDSLNDLPMLAAVDYPVAVQKPDGSYESGFELPDLIRAAGVGPSGWNRSLLDLLARL